MQTGNEFTIQFGTLTELLVAIAALISIVIGSIVSWKIFKKEFSRTYLQERYEKVIYPIFITLEKHMFKKELTPEIKNAVTVCKEIIHANHMIAGGELVDLFSRRLTVENFQDISREVDKQYDKTCKQLGIPVRRLIYKIMHYEWRSTRLKVLFFLKYVLLYPLLGLIAGAILLCMVLFILALLLSLLKLVEQSA